jgi:hypothetical protein
VEAVVGLVVGEDQQAAEHRLQEDGGLGGAEEIPEADRGPIAVPGGPADREGNEVERDQGAANDDMDGNHGYFLLRGSGFGLLMRKITM